MPLITPFVNPDRLFLAIVVNVNYDTGVCTLNFFRPNDNSNNTIVAQPYAGRGWGVFCGVEPGTTCLCALDSERKVYIVGYLPDPVWLNDDLSASRGIGINEFNYPKVVSGELVLQSKQNARVALNRFGDVSLETPSGTRLVLDSNTDTLELLSAQQVETTEAYKKNSGAIKRDIRSEQEKIEEPLIGSSSAFDYDINPVTEFVGFDPTYKPESAPALSEELLSGSTDTGLSSNTRASIQNSFTILPNGLADLSLGETGPSLYKTDSVNPPLTEIFETFYEFADSNVGIDRQEVADELKAVGKFNNNVLGRRVLGTHVNEIGKVRRFDYGFADGSVGHGSIWNTVGQGIHEDGHTTDDYFDRNNTLSSPLGEARDDFEWTVETLERTDSATMYDMTLRTRGVDHAGTPELEETGGVYWFVRVAKDGLTKINVPAATSLNSNEFYREGRSVLANFAGSVEASFGKQLCTSEKGLDRITGVTDNRANFVNMNNYPNYGRKDRSVALDLQGNLECLVGGDSNTNQSIMLQADGSLSAFFGKESVQSSGQGLVDTLAAGTGAPISTACLAQDRQDRSITVRTLGNVEAHFHRDDTYQQSLMITTEGGNRLMSGSDSRNRSVDVHTTGGIRVEVQGPMTKQNYALEIDLEGNMHIYVNGKVDIQSTGDMRLHSDGNFNLDVTKNFYGRVMGDMNWSVGGKCVSKIDGGEFKNVSGGRQTFVSGGDKLGINGSREVSVRGDSIETVTQGSANLQAQNGVNIDGGVVSVNAGLASTTSVSSPSTPVNPKDIFVSDRESQPITLDLDNTQNIPEPRESDSTGLPPVTQQLEESIDPRTNRIVNPFSESSEGV